MTTTCENCGNQDSSVEPTADDLGEYPDQDLCDPCYESVIWGL